MHDQYLAAQRRVTVQVCGNVARIAGQAFAARQSEIRRKIEVAESTKLPGWQYHVHALLADESVMTEWLSELSKAHAHLERQIASEKGGAS